MILSLFIQPVAASAIQAPTAPRSAEQWMPSHTESLPDALLEMLRLILPELRPDLSEALHISAALIAAAILVSLLQFSKSSVTSVSNLSSTVCAATILLGSTKSLLNLAVSMIAELAQYSKLFFPVIAVGLASQGAVGSSTALYLGSAMFSTLLCNTLASVAVPIIFLFLSFAIAHSAIGEGTLKKGKDLVRKGIEWFLKTILSFFISYMGITGAISGTTDAAKLKAAKTAISSMVPVLGGTLSNASEAILIGAGLAKNAAGIYGIYAMFAIFLAPFLRIGIHYFILKCTAFLCSLFDAGNLAELTEDFSSAMGLLLAMTGSLCLLLLISTICFLRGGS